MYFRTLLRTAEAAGIWSFLLDGQMGTESGGQSHNFERKVLVTREYHRVELKGSGSSLKTSYHQNLVLCILHFSAYQFDIFL